MVGRGLARNMDELMEEIRNKKNEKGRPFLTKKGTPFSREIVNEPLLASFRPTRIGGV